MKLPTKRIIFVGFAFFLICTIWQANDTNIPKILTDKFGMSQSLSGIVKALDNILALFILPLFGAISDRTKHRLGKRTPYILIGTVVAAVFLVTLTFADNAQLKNIAKVSAIDDEEALTELYNHQYSTELKTPDGEVFDLHAKFTREEFVSIRTTRDGETDPYYVQYVVPARQAYAREVTAENPVPLIVFIGLLLVILIAMATFRSPAVALMPDVTPKPLRSQANAIINLMGTIGGILVLGMGIAFKTGSLQNSLMSYTSFFAVVAGVMIFALLIFLWQVKEPTLVKKAEEESKALGVDEGEEEEEGKKKLSRAEKISLLFLLLSVVLWFMGYNAVTSKYSVYAGKVLNLDYNTTLLIANAAATVAYIPVGLVAS
ncbi:MAG: MFS transporter, partial [Clostridia bacterium]|nr:MFS transporter [Clostridia bacterium]